MVPIPDGVDKDVYFKENIQKRLALMNSLTDTELGIFQKNWYYGFHKKEAIWPVTNFTDYPSMPEFEQDPVMQKLRPLYITLQGYRDILPFSDDNISIRKEVEEVSIDLSRLATQMGNRDMDEKTYKSLLENNHSTIAIASDLINRLQIILPNLNNQSQ